MTYWAAILGGLIVALTLREVYRDLFHPTASGSLSDFVAKATFNVFRHAPKLLTDAGPLSIVLVIVIWAFSVCLGFALIYWAMPPEYYATKSGSPQTGFLPMVYFSLEIVTTLGLGDYAASPVWLRLLTTFEALVGFAVLTASISSIVLVHEALARMRTLARKLSIVSRSKREYGTSFESCAEQLLTEFSAEVVRTRVDLIQLPVVYYFYADHDHSSLPPALWIALELATAGGTDGDAGTRRGAAMLMVALRDLAQVVRTRFVPTEEEDCEVVFRAYAEHHSPARSKRNGGG